MDLRLSDLQSMQTELQNLHPEWGKIQPSRAREQLLWGVCELGEAIEIVKKRGDDQIMNDAETRRHFIEEMADVMMYMTDVLMCYGVSPEEYSEIHTAKHERNMKRNFKAERVHMFEKKD